MKKIKVAIVGYGNVGKMALEAIQEAPDMELIGVVRRASSLKGSMPEELKNTQVVSSIKELDRVDVAILCSPSRLVPQVTKELLTVGINTVDSYDIHSGIWDLKQVLDPVAKQHNAVAVVSAGWDPGSDSIVRALFQALAPKGITYTNFGPGMSMGHSVAAKAKEGVKEALAMTIPAGAGVHNRMVYIELEDGADFLQAEKDIRTDPYFAKNHTIVIPVDSVDNLKDMGHGVLMERKGVSGRTHNQSFEFRMRINNPALTSQILIAAARASVKQRPGAYTLIEIPVIDLLYGDREKLIKALV
jgi:diaminopimelate dehydrogenase